MIGNLLYSVSPKLHQNIIAFRDGEFEFVPPRRIYSEPIIHRTIKALLGAKPGFFIEAGANNGLHRSNTHYLSRWCGWSGILVEAIPHRAVQCRANRPEDSTVHCGLVSTDYDKPFVELAYMDMMSAVVTDTNALDIKEHRSFYRSARKRRDVADGMTFMAPARTLDSILRDHDYPEVDFFSLDVEGLELDVLKGIDFDRSRPKFILVEDWDREGIKDFLGEKGYRRHSQVTDKDTLYQV